MKEKPSEADELYKPQLPIRATLPLDAYLLHIEGIGYCYEATDADGYIKENYISKEEVRSRIRELEENMDIGKDLLRSAVKEDKWEWVIFQAELIKKIWDELEVLRGLLEKKGVLYIRPAPGTCCPEMNIKKGVCLGCGTKKKKPEKT